MKNIFLFFFCMTATLFGVDTKCCFIRDCSKHEANQKLFKSIIDQEITLLDTSMAAKDQADYLMRKISELAKRLLDDGFATDAYGIPEINENTIASYYSFPIWEGGGHMESIPVTFFVYVWPSQESILEYHPSHSGRFPYGTKIHSHPIPCAFAVLDGILTQSNYERVGVKSVRWTAEEQFARFEGALDLMENPFIHQVYTKGMDFKPAISLHAYGLPYEEKVRQCFLESRCTHYFDDVVD